MPLVLFHIPYSIVAPGTVPFTSSQPVDNLLMERHGITLQENLFSTAAYKMYTTGTFDTIFLVKYTCAKDKVI